MSTHPPSESRDLQKRIGVVLLSGGLDSATVLAIAAQECDECVALSFEYGQRHQYELESARAVAQANNVKRHVVLRIDLNTIGASALTDDALAIPHHKAPDKIATNEIAQGPVPITYVPAHNTIFLSFAVALAESVDARDIYIGANAIDYSGYPDCRPEFIEAFERAANLGTKIGTEGGKPIRINAPLIDLTKAQIIQRGTELDVNYGLTHSCYDPDPATGAACGTCDACILRKRGFEAAGVPDPTRYQ